MAINGCSGGSGYVAVTAGSESGWRKAQKMAGVETASVRGVSIWHTTRRGHRLDFTISGQDIIWPALWSRGGKTVQNSEEQRKAGTAICRIGKLKMSHKQN